MSVQHDLHFFKHKRIYSKSATSVNAGPSLIALHRFSFLTASRNSNSPKPSFTYAQNVFSSAPCLQLICSLSGLFDRPGFRQSNLSQAYSVCVFVTYGAHTKMKMCDLHTYPQVTAVLLVCGLTLPLLLLRVIAKCFMCFRSTARG